MSEQLMRKWTEGFAAADWDKVASTYAESDGHGGPEELDEKALRREAAPHAHAVEVGFYYRNA